MNKRILSVFLVLFVAFSLCAKGETAVAAVPDSVAAWINNELAKAKRKTLMDIEAGEFFSSDTARLIGYIKDYDPAGKYSTGKIYTFRTSFFEEEFPVTIQIHEDGRFEGDLSFFYPRFQYVVFDRACIYFYIEPGQTLSMILDGKKISEVRQKEDWEKNKIEVEQEEDWEKIEQEEDWATNKIEVEQYQGVTADISKELAGFFREIIPVDSLYKLIKEKTPDEFVKSYEQLMEIYKKAGDQIQLKAGNFSPRSIKYLQNAYHIIYVEGLLNYAMIYNYRSELKEKRGTLPPEFFDFMQVLPMNDPSLLSCLEIEDFVYALKYYGYYYILEKIERKQMPKKTFEQYLFEDKKIRKTQKDKAFLAVADSLIINYMTGVLHPRDYDLLDYIEYHESMVEKYGEKYGKEYEKKYMAAIKPVNSEKERWRLRDSLFVNELKLQPGIIYDFAMVRALENVFFNLDSNEALDFLNTVTASISNPFLKKEADRIFRKHFPDHQ